MNAYIGGVFELEQSRTSIEWLRTTLDDKYENVDLNKEIKNNFQHLTEELHNKWLKLLQKHQRIV